MAGRYTGWHARAGDVNASPALRDLGKKLLGEIEQAQRLGGTTVTVRRGALDDGSTVTASIIGGIPRLQFTPPGAGGEAKPPRFIEGFIVRPSDAGDQDANPDLNHALLLFAGEGYRPVFYDEAHKPVGLECGIYGRTFPAGLAYGNVDWRNDDQHMQVNWLGPNGRYFGATEGAFGGPIVWCKGRVLFDTRDLEAVNLGIGDTAVQGACLRRNRGLWLYVVVRTSTYETLARFQVKSQRDRSALRAAGTVLEEHLFVDLAIVPSSGEILAGHSIFSNNGVHPWCFNASGTEARRIDSSNSANGNIEWILTEDTAGEWAFSSVQHVSTRTVSEVLDAQEEAIGLRYQVLATDAFGNVEVDRTNSFTLKSLTFLGNPWTGGGAGNNWTYDDVSDGLPAPAGTVLQRNNRRFTARTGTFTRTETRTAERLPTFVDYRGDAVVYGYGVVANEVASYQRVLDERTGSGSFTGTVTLGSVDPRHTRVLAHQYDEAQTYTFTESRSRVDEGLETDFLTVQAGFFVTNVGSESYSLNYDSTLTEGIDESGTPFSVPGTTTDDETLTGSAAYSEVTEQVELHFLDLRYRHAYLHTRTITVERVTAGTVEQPVVGGIVTPSGTWTDTTTTTTDRRVRVIVGGLAQIDLTESNVSNVVSTRFDGDERNGLPPTLALFSAIGEGGATIGLTEDTTTAYVLRTADRTAGSSSVRGAAVFGSAFQMRDTYDFPGSSLFAMGQIVSASDRWCYSLAGKDTPPVGQLPYYNGLSAGSLDASTGDQAGVVRYHPVSYLPRTVIVR